MIKSDEAKYNFHRWMNQISQSSEYFFRPYLPKIKA